MSKPRFGWRKSPYKEKDLMHKAKVMRLPDVVDLSKYLPGVRDQGGVGSCTGFGIGGNVAGLAMAFGLSVGWFSPWWIYNGARYLAGDLMYDDGADPRQCLDWLVKKGCLIEAFWPYKDGTSKLDTTSPPSKYNVEAAKYPLAGYADAVLPQMGFYRVTGGAAGIMQALADAQADLAAGKPEHLFVSLGCPWPAKWMDPKNGMCPIPKKSDSVVGGHETFIYAGDTKIARFGNQNSWGFAWGGYPWSKSSGNKGYFTIPFEAFDWFNLNGGYDAHIIKVKWAVAPAPPAPTPAGIPIKVVRADGTVVCSGNV